MHIIKFIAVTITALILGASPSFASFDGNKYAMSAKLGGVVFIMNQQHFTLYVYAKDNAGVSNCYDECAKAWPPALLKAGTQLGDNYSLIKRNDGTMQIAYKSQPLYLFAKDKAIGEKGGENISDLWKVAVP